MHQRNNPIGTEKEVKELNQFAGIYSFKSTFFQPKPSERMKNITKVSMQQGKSTQQKKESGKPKFVELHQYPGFESSELTPLPHDVSAVYVFTKVGTAHPRLKKMAGYQAEFEKLFYSQMSQAILQDTFWWLFLERWQPCLQDQQKRFNRVAHNYVKLMTYAKSPKYRETFLKDFPTLLSQAVYAAFCWVFPDSYRQFGEEFKDILVGLVHEWIAGVHPPPRCWMSWDFEKLEPSGLKNREERLNNTRNAKKASGQELDWLADFGDSQGGMGASHSTLNHIGSGSSVSSQGPGKRNRKYKNVTDERRSLVSHSRSHDQGVDLSGAIQQVARAQASSSSPQFSVARGARQDDEDAADKREITSLRPRFGKDPSTESRGLEPLAPIRESAELHVRDAKHRVSSPKWRTKQTNKPESHPLGKGPSFTKGVFNTYGQSPLVAHFLRVNNLQIDAGLHARVQRTELQSLPPLGATTYSDVIQESFKSVRELDKKYKELVDKGRKESVKFLQKQRTLQDEHRRKEAALLSNKHEVKRISDLIMLELKKDQDSIGAGVSVAIDAAMEAAR